ncbi:SNARE domain-containing protein [Streptomyces avermitilis]|uniref:hypothetical protein n=1 Tax=Streptomyces avermitilis TaxID=33903 RepID=UPI0036B73FE3
MTSSGADHEALALALDHAWRWYENRIGRGYQVVNAMLIWTAILATAYAAALNADMHGVAGLISLICGASLGGAYREGKRLRASAALAEDVIMKIQERLATTLTIDSLRLVERERATSSSSRMFWHRPVTTQTVFIGMVVSLSGAVYTWVATP